MQAGREGGHPSSFMHAWRQVFQKTKSMHPRSLFLRACLSVPSIPGVGEARLLRLAPPGGMQPVRPRLGDGALAQLHLQGMQGMQQFLLCLFLFVREGETREHACKEFLCCVFVCQ